MKIAIYGAGKCGEYVIQSIKAHKESKIEGVLFIDNDPAKYGKTICNLPIVNLDYFIGCFSETVESVLIAVGSVSIAQEMAVSLLKLDYTNIYILPEEVWKAKLPIVNDNGEIYSYIKSINLLKPILLYLEYHVSDYCNLKCKRCGHLSNLVAEKKFPNINRFKKELIGLSQRFRNIKTFRLMGGEPFANPDLGKYIYRVREIFPYTDIQVVTNGLLLPKISRYTIDAIKESGAWIDITQYPPTSRKIEEILEFVDANQLKIDIHEKITRFCSQLTQGKPEDEEKIFHNCISRTCYFLREGRIYCCPLVALGYENRDFLGLNVSKEMMFNNSFDLTTGKENGWDILKKILYPNEFCKYCTKAEWHNWEISGEIRREDWFVK